MRTLRSAAIGAVLAICLSSCSTDHSDAAISLEQELTSMSGVRSVSQTYQAGNVLLPGSLTIQVALEESATADDAVAIVRAAWGAFDTTFRRDGADLALRRRGTEVVVHTQDPRADLDDVLEIVRFALEAPLPGERMAADIVVFGDEDYGDLVSELRFSLRRGSSQNDLVPRVESLASAGGLPEGTDIWVLSADGAGLGGSRGLPTADDIALWRELTAVPAPGTIRVEFGPAQLYSELDDFGFANVSVRGKPAATKPDLADMKAAHTAALAERSDEYIYNVTVNGRDRIWLRGP